MKFPFVFHFLRKQSLKFRIIRGLFVLIICSNPGFTAISFSNTVSVPEKSGIDSLTLLLKKPQSHRDKIITLSALGKAYYNESELDEALETQKQLLESISKHGTKLDSAKCFRLFGLIYMKKSWYDKSLDNLMRAQQLFGEAGDSSLQATALMNAGIVHDYMQNLPMALSYYEKALRYFKRKQDLTGAAGCELNIAIVLTKQKKYQMACENLLAAAKIYEKTGNEGYLAAAYINLGLTYKKMNYYDLAIEYHNKALAIWQQEDDQYHICYYHLNMGEIMLDLKKPDDAYFYLAEAEKIAQTLGSKDLQAKAYEFLSDYNAAKKNFTEAYSYLNKSKQINDSILNAETTEKVNQIQYQYEIAKRESDNDNLVKQNLKKELELSKKNQFLFILTGILIFIAVLAILLVNKNRNKRRANKLLIAKNNLIETQKDELIKLNASKDKFLSILAHDIKNPLSSIFGISDLLVTDYDRLTQKEKKIFTQDIHTLSASLFEMINTLLTWSISQNGMIAHRPNPFSIAGLCNKSILNLQTVAKQKDIELVSQATDDLSVNADENMILSVLHNLINNAIKYSYHGTRINIETKRVDGFAEISVIDSGIGLSPESQAKLFRYDQHFLSKGTAGESGTGLGLILCKDFVEKNGGTIKVDSTINKGSTFIFTLPLASV
jgi:signal transduction histidine kinase